MAKKLVDLMLDSGVFSAWNRGEELDIRKYISYVKKHQEFLFSYVSMDRVPDASDERGSPPTRAECEKSGKMSYDNLRIMRKAGLRPIPVFHQGESFDWLHRMVDDGEDYIGISPWKRMITIEQQQEWFDRVFSMLTDDQGRPLIKTHGFGVTHPGFLKRYPFYTVDSTTWSLTPGFGVIIMPAYDPRAKTFDFEPPPYRIITSGVQQMNASSMKRQLEFYTKAVQASEHWEATRLWLKQCGLSITAARYSSDARRKATLLYFQGLVGHIKNVRFTHQTHSLLYKTQRISGKPIAIPKLRIMYATSLLKSWSALLTEHKANTRLLSYYELRDKPIELLQKYVQTGNTGAYKQRHPKTDWNREEYKNYRRMMLYEKSEADLMKEDIT